MPTTLNPSDLAYYTFKPRPNQPHRYDQQLAFFQSQHPGVTFLLGGNGAGCLAAEQEVYDPVVGRSRRVDSIDGPFHVWALDSSGNRVIANAMKPKIYGTEDLYEIRLSNGKSFRATLGHRVLTETGWRELGDIVRESLRSQFQGEQTGQLFQADQDTLKRILNRSQEGLRFESETDSESCGFDALVREHWYQSGMSPESAKAFSTSCASPSCVLVGGISGNATIISARFIRQDVYWDFSVETYENYWMEGIYHHNTSTLALAKMVEFILTTPPPRKDTPFWIIAESYEQTMNVCWKEKLDQLGHLPPQEVEWERIRWYKPNNNWPFSVPLKPWPGRPGKNWQLVFKSYDQGRGKMQGESIGGFLFVEQFPWGLLEEVLRGCREYAFCGNKLAEFTPVNPAISMQLQEMEENGKLPEGWAIYRANTECAVEAGHVSQQWFNQFFGMVPEAMRDVRTKGLWGGFEGSIYPEFDPQIHCMPPGWDIEPGYHHRRMIDWGFGVDNAFCCLFGCRNGSGQWYIYDEYYSTDTQYTVVDHLKAISDRHPWPKSNPYYGVTWADPSNLNCHRIASKLQDYAPGYDSINIQAANNSVDEGIEHVKWLLKPDPALAIPDVNGGRPQPRLFISREDCPNLIRQMRTYRRLRSNKTGLNPRDAADQVLKSDDHACFPAGSMVDTPMGPKPIETLKCGDEVYSHLGVATVDIDAALTGISSTVVVILEDSCSVECTVEHPLAISHRGWCKAADSLGQQLNVRPKCEHPKLAMAMSSKSLNTVGTNGVDTRLTREIRHGDTFVEASVEAVNHRNCNISGCISKSTLTTSARSQMGLMCTTKTGIPGTIHQKTLKPCLGPIIKNCTSKTSERRLQKQPNGIGRQKVLSGTNCTESSLGKIEARELLNVSNAAVRFKHEMPGARQDSAPISANTMQGWRLVSTISECPAKTAARRSLQIVIARRKLARRNVGLARCVSVQHQPVPKPVFNLSTSDGTFFVNGVLVSNCDALRYGVFSEASMTGMTPTTIAKEHSPHRHGVQVDSKRLKRQGQESAAVSRMFRPGSRITNP